MKHATHSTAIYVLLIPCGVTLTRSVIVAGVVVLQEPQMHSLTWCDVNNRSKQA